MAKSLGAKGTRNYQHRGGKNTSVRANQMSSHPTPARSVAMANTSNGQKVSGKGTIQNTAQFRTGNVRLKSGAIKQSSFQAPKSMPGRLNNTAAAAISTKRYRTAAIGSTVALAPPYGTIIGVALLKSGLDRDARNNYSTVKLKAAGYKVAKTGYGGVIKPASAKTQARAQAKLQRKTGSRVSTGKATVGTRAKGTPPKGGGGRRNFRPRRDSRGRWAGSY